MYPRSINNLIEAFKYLPGVGEKTAERLSFFLINMDESKINFFADSIKNIKERIHYCPICHNFTEDKICNICGDKERDNELLCVVEDPRTIFLIERLGTFIGKYHVLNGLISPIDGINPEDIKIDKLIDRIKKEKFKEIILAVKPSIEGETTSLYIKTVLDGMDVKVTRIASGIPLGADIEYIDSLTLERALLERREIS